MAKKTRLQMRQERMRRRLAEADTPEKRMSAAFDWLRSSSEYLGKRGSRIEGGRGPGYAAAARLMGDVAEYLARMAADIDGGRHDHAG
jgi:hypothetical protein